jgi:aspartate ammonia-lyase
MEPVIADCILESQTMFMNAATTLRVHCVEGITANQDICREYIERSIGVVTALNPVLGYDATNELAKEALETGKGIVELVREKGLLTEAEIEAVMDPARMAGPQRNRQ